MPRTSPVTPFFKNRGWRPFPFQKETWQAYREGKSGLLHAPTGLGKTLAVWLGPVAEAMDTQNTKGCRVLWITPLRALALDTQKSLQEPLDDLDLEVEIGMRTGDTSSYQKSKLRKKLPFCLITTPESLSLFLTHENFRGNLSGLTTIIIDEWHELIGTKRGVQTELCLSRLRTWFPDLRIWGLSATLGNTEQAKQVLLGDRAKDAVIISGAKVKKVQIKTILPRSIERFPWAGHIGTQLVSQVAKKLEGEGSTLLFTNTRSQTEIWFQELLAHRPAWKDELAMHHGSLDREERNAVEDRLREGSIRCVICTSSLDLGVDFSPVTQVIQIGSPKGIARLMQRAGRSGHSPGGTSKLFCVPSNALELIEFAAARDAILAKKIEARIPLQKPLDVLVQHLVTVCIGEPTSIADLRQEIKSTYAYRDLDYEEWQWAIEFITIGGKTLSSYPGYQKVIKEDGELTVTDKRLIQTHRLSIGTITSFPNIHLVYQSGRSLGTVEESFISKIPTGGAFIFGGRQLQLVRVRQQKAVVKNSTKKARGKIPVWAGSRMPLSNELAHAVARRLQSGEIDSPEMRLVAPVLELQKKWSRIPHDGFILIEQVQIRTESHLFVYPFAGRLVNEGLGSLIAWRISQQSDLLIQVTMNDYGFGLTSQGDFPFDEDSWRTLLSEENLMEDLFSCMNTAELARRQFREIARVSGLVQQGLPGKKAGNRDLQTSSNLLYEVFERYEPDNLLLEQARREILDNQLELTRLAATLKSLATRPIHFQECQRLSPMAFPLWAERLQAHYQGEDAATRLEKMLASLEAAAG
ncbi:MAG: ligase-associated DNA damage response DEXH box helicase [Akkermansiaceae bacterium]|nr:ligase-associated DNA damage response DEXH box helicase [Akkermansiaceae bacterium]